MTTVVHFLLQVLIPEDAAVGAEVAVVQARDPDSGDFGTQGIRYTDLRGSLADKYVLRLLCVLVLLGYIFLSHIELFGFIFSMLYYVRQKMSLIVKLRRGKVQLSC